MASEARGESPPLIPVSVGTSHLSVAPGREVSQMRILEYQAVGLTAVVAVRPAADALGRVEDKEEHWDRPDSAHDSANKVRPPPAVTSHLSKEGYTPHAPGRLSVYVPPAVRLQRHAIDLPQPEVHQHLLHHSHDPHRLTPVAVEPLVL